MLDSNAVIGMGLITPPASDLMESWEKVLRHDSGIGHQPMENAPPELQYAGRIPMADVVKSIPPQLARQVKYLNRSSIFGYLAADQAVRRSGDAFQATPPERRGLFISCGDNAQVGGGAYSSVLRKATKEHTADFDYRTFNSSVLHDVWPFILLNTLPNNAFSFLSHAFECKGANTSLIAVPPFGLQALELAVRSIELDLVDIALVVAAASLLAPVGHFEMYGNGSISQCRRGIHSFSPFDAERDGTIPGEGGAALVIGNAERALKRGTKPLARVLGTTGGFEYPVDGVDGSTPPRVLEKTLAKTLELSGTALDDLGFLVLHGNGTKDGDASELASVQAISEKGGRSVPLCGLKPHFGHMAAAGDLSEVIIGIMAASNGLIPGTLNFRSPDPAFARMNISAEHRPCTRKRFAVASYDYGMAGQSCCAVLESL